MAAPHRLIAPSSGQARSETSSADPPSAKRATPRLVDRGKTRSLITIRPSPPKTSTEDRSHEDAQADEAVLDGEGAGVAPGEGGVEVGAAGAGAIDEEA